MKKMLLFPLVLLLFFQVNSYADDFLEAPVISDAQVIEKTPSRLDLKTDLAHDEVLAFYKEALKDLDDIKYRDWSDATYIEDDGKRPWHSITISKGEGETTIIIVEDNWTWIIGTLILRYVAVFVVLMVLFICMTASGRIVSSAVKKAQAKKQAA
jgi:hypothetical protein